MTLKRALVGLGMLLAVSFGPIFQASALTVDEFDTLSGATQSRTLQLVFNGTYKYLESQDREKSRLGCVSRLFTPANTSSVSNGVKYLYEELDKARKTNPSIRVEDIVLGVMDRECAKPATKKAGKTPSALNE